MMLRNNRPTGGNWCIACNPVTGYYSSPIQTNENQTTDSGNPVIVYGDSPQAVCDMLFSAYELDVDNQLVSHTVRDISISVGYTSFEQAEANADGGQAEVDGLLMRPIKHPDRDEWALVWSDYVFDNHGVNGEHRATIASAHAAKVSANESKTPEEATALGWL